MAKNTKKLPSFISLSTPPWHYRSSNKTKKLGTQLHVAFLLFHAIAI